MAPATHCQTGLETTDFRRPLLERLVGSVCMAVVAYSVGTYILKAGHISIL
jgi:hypothetical protein